MKISKDARVRPSRHSDARINTVFGRYLSRMSQDEVHAAAFRYVEVKIAHGIRGRWEMFLDGVTESSAMNDEIRQEVLTTAMWNAVHEELLDYLRVDQQLLDRERERIRLNLALCARVLVALTDPASYKHLADDYARENRQSSSPLRFLEGSLTALDRAIARVTQSNKAWDEEMKVFSEKIRSRNAFAASPGSVSIATLDGASATSFEEWTARLLDRDGCTIVQAHGGANDRGADVIAICPGGRRIVLQCKYSAKPNSRISPRHVHQLNGTARPEHRADVVAMVTNRTLSQEAHSFALRNGILVVDRGVLTRWATYGVTWLPGPRTIDPAPSVA